jgi:hypothetical protein
VRVEKIEFHVEQLKLVRINSIYAQFSLSLSLSPLSALCDKNAILGLKAQKFLFSSLPSSFKV